MISISQTQAKDRFKALEKDRQKALSERDAEALKVRSNTARLKALRLARDAELLAAGPVAKVRTRKKPR